MLFRSITRQDLEVVGQKNDIQDIKTLIDTVAHAISKFGEFAKELDIDKALAESISADFVKV